MNPVYRLDLVYEGTAFKGWARQPGQRTVEGVLEDALRVALRRSVRLSVAGRTDAGVHALAQVASFTLPAQEATGPAGAPEPRRLRLALNALLPPDVAVTGVTPAADAFDARAALSRTYRYRLWVSAVRPVHERLYVWNVHGEVDSSALDAAARLLAGRRDFAALTPSAHLYHHCEREVLRAAWLLPVQQGPRALGAKASPIATAGQPPRGVTAGQALHGTSASQAPLGAIEFVFEIRATSFLHNMVRVAVGSMVDVAQGRLSLEAFAAGLASRERRRMGQTAPARGLALVAVEYGDAPGVLSTPG